MSQSSLAVDTCDTRVDPAYPIYQNEKFTINIWNANQKYGGDLRLWFDSASANYGYLQLQSDNTVTIDQGLPYVLPYTFNVGTVGRGGITGGVSVDVKCRGTIYIAGSCLVNSSTGEIYSDGCGVGYKCQPIRGEGTWQGSCSPDPNVVGNSTPPTAGGLGFGALAQCTDSSGNTIKGLKTPLGCIPSDPAGLINAAFRIILGFAGALAVIFIILGGFKIAASQGDPEALEDGRSMVTHAILGLVFILLATVILSIIGINILGLSSFSSGSGGVIISK